MMRGMLYPPVHVKMPGLLQSKAIVTWLYRENDELFAPWMFDYSKTASWFVRLRRYCRPTRRSMAMRLLVVAQFEFSETSTAFLANGPALIAR